MSIITISRQACSFGDEVAEVLSQKLGLELIDREKLLSKFFDGILTPYELKMLRESAKFYLNVSSNGETFIERLSRSLHEYAKTNSAILIGFASQVIFKCNKDAINIRIMAPHDIRITRIKKQYHVSASEAEQILLQTDKKHKKFVYTLFQADWTDPSYYDMILNTGGVSVDECVSSIIALFKERELRIKIEKEQEESNIINNISEVPIFKNTSEKEFAQILDMYQIEWKYEPKTFPVEWDAEGNVTSAFSPDFYLTKFDTYIELTTMNQKYVTEKNKKIKRLNQLYPGINIKIVYKKDFYSLLERFKICKGE
ncbi:MAG: cytidylate kinase family protein [Eubacteriales bacterium]